MTTFLTKITSSGTDDLISDLAQLIKHASRASIYSIPRLMETDHGTNFRFGFIAIIMLLIDELRMRNELPDKDKMHQEQLKLYQPINHHEHDDVKMNYEFYMGLLGNESTILERMERTDPEINAIKTYKDRDEKLHANPPTGAILGIPVVFKVIDCECLPLGGVVKRQLKLRRSHPSPHTEEIGDMSFDLLFEYIYEKHVDYTEQKKLASDSIVTILANTPFSKKIIHDYYLKGLGLFQLRKELVDTTPEATNNPHKSHPIPITGL